MRAILVVVLISACGRVGFEARSDATDASTLDTPVDGMASFVDTFDRADSAMIGNGWTEKTPGTFAIQSQQVGRVDYTLDYRNLFVARPIAEDQLDVAVAIEFTVGHVPPGYPQIHARVQRSTIATADTLDGYLLYIEGTSGNGYMAASMTRQHGTVLPAPLTTFALSPQLAVGQTYRLRLSVRGTTPVQLDGAVDQLTGSTWTTIGSASTTDAAANAVTTKGAVGFDAGQPEAAGYYTYDQFTYTPL